MQVCENRCDSELRVVECSFDFYTSTINVLDYGLTCVCTYIGYNNKL